VPFLMIARNCLRRDPGRRSTITAITDRLQPANATRPQPSARPAKPVVAKAPSAHVTSAQAAPSKSYLLPVIVITLLLVAGVAGLRYVLRPSAVQPAAPSTASSEKPPVAAPAPAPQPSPKPSAATPSGPASPARSRRSAGVTAQGAVLNQVLPDVPPSAVLTITGHFRITVKVTVDATGKVTDATLETAGPSQYFARKCVEAARSWTFTPPQVRDQSAPSEWVIHFAFSHSGIEPSATQTAP
jgi:TonB family protein